jgi:putative alpha-1,2-mannosidase
MRGLKLITRNNIRMYSTPNFNNNFYSKKNYVKSKEYNYEINKPNVKKSYLYMYNSLPIKSKKYTNNN